MTELRIIKGDCWYSKLAGKKFPILGFSPSLGFLVLEDEFDTKWYVKASDCEIDVKNPSKEQEIVYKLFPNQHSMYVDEPVKFYIGDLVDLRSAEKVEYKKWQSFKVPLGIGMQLPEGFKAAIYPRSGLYNRYHLILANSVGQIDNSYSGNDDQWCAVFYPTEDGILPFNERILQFEIQPIMPPIKFTRTEVLLGKNRSGFGEGTKHEK